MIKPALFGYQSRAIELGQRLPAVLFRIPPGGGKTRIQCEMSRGLAETSILWLSPLTAIPHIVRQIQLWGAPYWRVMPAIHFVPSKADVVVLSYSRVDDPVIQQALHRRRFDRIVIDEAHFIKNLRTQRTMSVYGSKVLYKSGGLIDCARRATVMSGTLAPNGNPLEIYPHMRALFPKTLLQDDKVMGESAFAQMYTHGEPTMNGWKVHSTKNVSNLMKRLQPVLLNVPQSEVDKELPAFSMEVVPLDEALSNELALAQQDKRVWALADHIQAYGQLPAPHALEDAHISTLLRLIGMAKIAPVLEMAREFLLQTNKKLVLYVKHIDVLRGLHNNLTDYKPAAVHGAVPAALRERELERFRSDKECRVFIAQMDTAGTGFDLVEASDAWFAEITWNPSTILQAAKRLHRPGQRRPVAVRLFSLQGTLDTAVERVIARKTGQIREAFQD